MRFRILVLGFVLVLGAGLYAQVFRNQITGEDRIHGRIQILDKAKSTMSVQQIATAASPEIIFHVVYDENTAVTLNGKTPAKTDDLKKELQVVITGKSEKDILKASLIDIRTEN
jgi:hypothetical protein